MQVDSLPSKPPGKPIEHITCIIKHANIKNISNVFCAQSPLPMEFSNQEYQSEVPFPTPGDLPDPAIEPASPASPALAGGFFTTVPPGKLLEIRYFFIGIWALEA